jgi:hypothetical protein
MAFGKRAAGDPLTPREPDPTETEVSIEGVGKVRTRVTNAGGMDHKFIALAAGVVVLSAGAAIAAPSLMSAISGGARPIKEVVAGLDRQQTRSALASEAFPDEDGKVFMTSLATHYPKEHGRLLDALADSAMAGGERDELYLAVNAWSMNFAVDALPAVSRSGAEGFDKAVAILNDGMRVLESEAGGCTGRKLESFLQNPNALTNLTRYGGKGYHLGMRATREFVELAAKGRNAPRIDTRLNANDMNALQSTFFSLISDPQVSSLIQMSGSGGMENSAVQQKVMDELNVCQLARAIVIKLEKLPAPTKARLLGTALSGDPTALLAAQGFASPFGGGMPDFSSGAVSFRP